MNSPRRTARIGDLQVVQSDTDWTLGALPPGSAGIKAFALISLACAAGAAYSAWDCFLNTRGLVSKAAAVGAGALLATGFAVWSLLLVKRSQAPAQALVRFDRRSRQFTFGREALAISVQQIEIVRLGRGSDGEYRYDIEFVSGASRERPISAAAPDGLPRRTACAVCDSVGAFANVPVMRDDSRR